MSSNDQKGRSKSSSLEEEDQVARDFLPPPSQVRLGRKSDNNPDATSSNDTVSLLRTSPVLGRTSRRAAALQHDEELARQAARDQLLLPPSNAKSRSSSSSSKAVPQKVRTMPWTARAFVSWRCGDLGTDRGGIVEPIVHSQPFSSFLSPPPNDSLDEYLSDAIL
jgi:hypothetical protein